MGLGLVKGKRPIATEAALDTARVQRPASVRHGPPAGRDWGTERTEPERAKGVTAWHERVRSLERDVLSHGAAVMSGNTLYLAEFERLGPVIVQEGLVTQGEVDYVLNGIRNGFDLGIDESRIRGKRVHRNYKSAYEKRVL